MGGMRLSDEQIIRDMPCFINRWRLMTVMTTGCIVIQAQLRAMWVLCENGEGSVLGEQVRYSKIR